MIARAIKVQQMIAFISVARRFHRL